jgi:hypothetical protein
MRPTIEKALVGKYIERFSLDGMGGWITFHLRDGEQVHLEAWGDCCSQSWIESIDAPTVLHGKVLKVEDIDMPELGDVGTDKMPDVDVVAYYGLKITTEEGIAVLDYRNDSNGYYGGSLEVVEEIDY